MGYNVSISVGKFKKNGSDWWEAAGFMKQVRQRCADRCIHVTGAGLV